MLTRAQWLRSLSHAEREDLFERTLREVDDRFDEWLRRTGAGSEAPAP